MPTDQAMLDEAIAAARAGDKVRAKDLLTRLLRIDKNYPEHWLWMSAVVESRQEQIYCLQNLLRVDPDSVVARRGLAMMGALEIDPREVAPVPPQRRQAWSTADLELTPETGLKSLLTGPVVRSVLILAGGLIGLIILAAGVLSFGSGRVTPTPDFALTAAAVGAVVTLTPTTTPSLSPTPEFPTATPTPAAPTPLWFYLEATYTPTPLYIDTPHPETQAFRLGMNALARQDWEAVIEYMGQALEIAPSAVDALYYRGEAFLQTGAYLEALGAYEEAIQLDSSFGPAYLGRARAALHLDPEADVGSDFQDAIDLAPQFNLAYLERARYLVERGAFPAALADLERAAELDPESPLIPYLRARIAFSEADFETALEMAELAFEADFTHLPTYLLLGEINLALGDPAAAREWLEIYVFQRMDDPAGLNLLGRSYTESGAFAEALDIFNRLIEDGIANASTYYGRGMAYLETGDAEAALRDLNQATRLRRNDFDINIALGRTLLALGDPGDAYVQFNNTFALVQNDRELALIHYYRGLALKVLVDNGDIASAPAAVRDLVAALALSEYLTEDLIGAAEKMLSDLDPATPEE